MGEPVIAKKEPIEVELEAGTYNWCSCGKSKTQPMCDGAHQGSEFTPVEFKVDAKKKVMLCQCKRTKNPPFCDGAHTKL